MPLPVCGDGICDRPVAEQTVAVGCTLVAYCRWARTAVRRADVAALGGHITDTVAAKWLARATVGYAVVAVLAAEIPHGAVTDTVAAYWHAPVTVRLAVGAVLAGATDAVAAAGGAVIGTSAEGLESVAQPVGTDGLEPGYVQLGG